MIYYQTIYEDSNYLVINKPAGLLVHGAGHIKKISLVDMLVEKYSDIYKVGENPWRPGIVHRLDKQVSGLLVIAKTQRAFDSLKEQFQKRLIKKIYTALVYGHVDKDEYQIDFPIARNAKGYKMAALPKMVKGELEQKGRRAITEFDVIKKTANYSLLKIRIKTGRTHQIRVHLTAYGHPVVGDNLYGTKKTKGKNMRLRKKNLLKPDRILLSAIELSFTDLQGEVKKFKIDIPNDINKIIA